jgi:hypothetical protein
MAGRYAFRLLPESIKTDLKYLIIGWQTWTIQSLAPHHRVKIWQMFTDSYSAGVIYSHSSGAWS